MSLRAERELTASQLEEDEKAFLQEHSIDIGAQSGATPSSVLLTPIQERVTPRRKRKKRAATAPEPSGFPKPVKEGNSKSLFARDYAKRQAPPKENPTSAPASEAEVKFQSMSEAEKEEALEEIYAKLSPEMIQFIQHRSATKQKGDRSLLNGPSVPDVDMDVDLDIRPAENTGASEAAGSSMSEADTISAGIQEMQLGAQSVGGNGVANASAGGTHALAGGIQQMQLSAPTEGDVPRDASYLVSQGVRKEADKLEWMQDESGNTSTEQDSMEAAMQKSVSLLGDIGKRRFDLRGKMLTEEQVHNLPTHLGLHHHGSNPSEAGYTMTEILLLTRSSVPTQRVIAYSVFARILFKHRQLILEPLLKCGALPLVFSKSVANNPGAAVAQLFAAEAVVKGLSDMGVRELSGDLYFASIFYSPYAVESPNPVLEALQQSDLVPSLITFAHSWFRKQQTDFCVRALHLIRVVVRTCPFQLGKEIVSKTCLAHLQEMASHKETINSLVPFLACDILSYYVLFLGWAGVEESGSASVLFKNKSLKSFGRCMHFYLKLPQKLINEETHLASAASLRVLRAALTFDTGLNVFQEHLPAICAVSFAHGTVSSSGEPTPACVASREAFLALEALVHALYSTANRLQGEKDKAFHAVLQSNASGSESAKEEATKAADAVQEKIQSIQAQIVSLLPLAHNTVRLFLQGNFTSHRAAAGHFAGSVVSLLQEPLPAELAPQVLQVAKLASEALANQSTGTQSTESRWIASSVHAAGRILSKSVLPEAVVGQICRGLIAGAEIEASVLEGGSCRFIRPTANACAEWLVKFAKLRPNKETVLRGIQLLPYMAEPQAIIELLFKCIVYPPLLEVLNPKLTKAMGEHIVGELSSPTLTKLLREQGAHAEEKHEKGAPTLAAFSGVVQWWLCAPETVEHGALVTAVLVSADLVSPAGVYRAAAYASPLAFVPGSMLTELVLEAGSKAYHGSNRVFHPLCNTAVSVYSAEKRPPMAQNFYAFAEHLTQRGPFVSENDKPNEDVLASLVFTTMCRRDADTSLRQHLWRTTVLDCGGAALFANAHLLGGVGSIEGEDDEDVVVGSYCQALADGLLHGARCPDVLQQVISARLSARLLTRRNLHTMEPLRSCHPQGRLDTEETLTAWMQEWRKNHDVSLVKEFFSN